MSKLLDRYILKNYLLVLVLVNLVLVSITVAYSFAEVSVGFKEKSLKIFFMYSLNLVPLAFLYLLPISSSFALVVVFRRLMLKNIDRLVQSFGISPLRMSASILLLSLAIGGINLLLSDSFYPKRKELLYTLEKSYKKSQETYIGILKDFWFTIEKDGITFVNLGYADLKKGYVANYLSFRIDKGSFVQVVKAKEGHWEGNRVRLSHVSFWDGKEVKRLDEYQETVIDIREAKPYSRKLDFMSFGDILILYKLGRTLGMNTQLYLYEFLKRLFTAFSTMLVIPVVIYQFLRKRSVSLGLFLAVGYSLLVWLAMGLLGSFAYAPLLLLLMTAYSLKALYNLGKGIRV